MRYEWPRRFPYSTLTDGRPHAFGLGKVGELTQVEDCSPSGAPRPPPPLDCRGAPLRSLRVGVEITRSEDGVDLLQSCPRYSLPFSSIPIHFASSWPCSIVVFLLEVRVLVGLRCLRYLVDVVFVWGPSVERSVGFCEFFSTPIQLCMAICGHFCECNSYNLLTPSFCCHYAPLFCHELTLSETSFCFRAWL